jgi:hypothetical protein
VICKTGSHSWQIPAMPSLTSSQSRRSFFRATLVNSLRIWTLLLGQRGIYWKLYQLQYKDQEPGASAVLGAALGSGLAAGMESEVASELASGLASGD